MLKSCADPSIEIKKDGLSFVEYVAKRDDRAALDLIKEVKCEKER
jgi:hypothetical protein